MSRKTFTKDEMAELRGNPAVASVTVDTISFTPEFKREAYGYMLEGKHMRTILAEHGINPDLLGSNRIWGLAANIKKQSGRDNQFRDLRDQNTRRQARETKEQNLSERVEQLEHLLAYTRQEVEFLKKTHAADMEAWKSWESKHPQK